MGSIFPKAGTFPFPLKEKLLKDDSQGLYQLLSTFGFDSLWFNIKIRAKKNFITDHTSVPNIPIIHEAFGGYARGPGTIHDELYNSHEISRLKADLMLCEMLVAEEVPDWKIPWFFISVRLKGANHWKRKHRHIK